MRATNNLIAGEVAFIKKRMQYNNERTYLKLFNNKRFIEKVIRQLKYDCKDYEITLKENKYEYILRINKREITYK